MIQCKNQLRKAGRVPGDGHNDLFLLYEKRKPKSLHSANQDLPELGLLVAKSSIPLQIQVGILPKKIHLEEGLERTWGPEDLSS